MDRLFPSLLWFLLVPYFAVQRLNAPPGIGRSRVFTNRTNAQVILGLILVSPILFALASTGYLKQGFPRTNPYVFALVVYVPAIVFVSAWLKGEREAAYRRKYRELSPPLRAAFGLTTVALIVAGVIVFIVPR